MKNYLAYLLLFWLHLPATILSRDHVDESTNFLKLKAIHSFQIIYKNKYGQYPASLKELNESLTTAEDRLAFYLARYYQNPETNLFEDWVVPVDSKFLIVSKNFKFHNKTYFYGLLPNGDVRKILLDDH